MYGPVVDGCLSGEKKRKLEDMTGQIMRYIPASFKLAVASDVSNTAMGAHSSVQVSTSYIFTQIFGQAMPLLLFWCN